jgi:predicted aspartyl protease
MIRGRLAGRAGRLRPFVTARLTVASQSVSDDVDFLIDTGADSTLLAPADALLLGIDTSRFSAGPATTGIGGTSATVATQATLRLGRFDFQLHLRILMPGPGMPSPAANAIPSLLGRDVLSHFALFFEERTGRVLLLEPHEADALALP